MRHAIFAILVVVAPQCGIPVPKPDQESGAFDRVFTVETGLGPRFNSVSCAECHETGRLGGSGDEDERHASFAAGPVPCIPDVIQAEAIPGFERDSVPPGASVATRSTPDVFGLGVIDGLAESEIVIREDPLDADGDGISGRVNRFVDGRVGRFGRKAIVPTLDEFVAGAFQLEQGVTVPGGPPDEDGVPDPELSAAELRATIDFQRRLDIRHAAQDGVGNSNTMGERLFNEVGCRACHFPEWSFTDVLLHDLGPENIPDGDICALGASEAEFRTEPLLGLRFQSRFMHDGKSKSIEDAIERHGGEGAASRQAFRDLPHGKLQVLLNFLKRL